MCEEVVVICDKEARCRLVIVYMQYSVDSDRVSTTSYNLTASEIKAYFADLTPP
jgi:hypothetical protein